MHDNAYTCLIMHICIDPEITPLLLDYSLYMLQVNIMIGTKVYGSLRNPPQGL